MSFCNWQAQYAAYGIATFPVAVGADGKKPLVSNYARFGLPASRKIAQKFPKATALGFMVGIRTRLTVLDVDSPNDSVFADALNRHGPTPIIVRTGSGHFQGWYRYNGEKRLIRPEREDPIDILGAGFVVAPPSHGIQSIYEFIQGSLDDLDTLPILLGIDKTSQSLSPAPFLNRFVNEGSRNNTLFRYCMKSAHYCDNLDALLDVARTENAEFSLPLPECEVEKTAKSAWGYTQRGENRFGHPSVVFDAQQADALIRDDPDLYLMLSLLRANNKPDSQFMATNLGLAAN